MKRTKRGEIILGGQQSQFGAEVQYFDDFFCLHHRRMMMEEVLGFTASITWRFVLFELQNLSIYSDRTTKSVTLTFLHRIQNVI
jgi:hypothetical protein